jgi:hypothetical protein
MKLFPIPPFEQIGDGVTETRQHVFAVEGRARAKQVAFGERAADLNALGFGINDLGQSRAAKLI